MNKARFPILLGTLESKGFIEVPLAISFHHFINVKMLSVITMVVGVKYTMKQALNDKKNEQNKKIILIDR